MKAIETSPTIEVRRSSRREKVGFRIDLGDAIPRETRRRTGPQLYRPRRLMLDYTRSSQTADLSDDLSAWDWSVELIGPVIRKDGTEGADHREHFASYVVSSDHYPAWLLRLVAELEPPS